jgi:hypothetical protein
VQLKNLWLRGKYHDSRQLVIWLWSSLAVVTLAYLIARFLKKSRILQAARVSSP